MSTELENGRLLLRVPEVMLALGLGKTAVHELLRTRQLRSVKSGRARLIPVAALHEYVARLEAEAEQDAA